MDTIRSGVPNQDANNANYEHQLKWSKAKRDEVMLRTYSGIEKPEQQENWGAHDELTVLAKMCKVQFILFETAQTTESQKITIGDDGLPPIAILNTDNLHFDFLKPRVTSVSCADITGDSDSEWGNNYERVQQPADGDCMYHSVIAGLRFVLNLSQFSDEWNSWIPSSVRTIIVGWILDDTNFMTDPRGEHEPDQQKHLQQQRKQHQQHLQSNMELTNIIAAQSKQIDDQEIRINSIADGMENNLRQLSEAFAKSRIHNSTIFSELLGDLSTKVHGLEQKLKIQPDGIATAKTEHTFDAQLKLERKLQSRLDISITDKTEQTLDVMEDRIGGLSAHMQNSLQRISISCAEAHTHNCEILNGRTEDISKEVRDMELRLQRRMDKMIASCANVSTRLEEEFMDVAMHLDTTFAKKTMGLANKMDELMLNMDSKFSLQLARHEEVSTVHHEQMSKEGVKLTKAIAEMEHSNLTSIIEKNGVQERIHGDHRQQLTKLFSATETRLQHDMASLADKFDETKILMDQNYSDMSSKVDLQIATALNVHGSTDEFIIDEAELSGTFGPEDGPVVSIKVDTEMTASKVNLENDLDINSEIITSTAHDLAVGTGVGPDDTYSENEFDEVLCPEYEVAHKIDPTAYSEIVPQIGQYAVIDDIVPAVDEDLKVTKDLQKELAVISTCCGLQRVEPDEIGQLSFPHLEAANRLDKPSSEKIGPGIDPDRY